MEPVYTGAQVAPGSAQSAEPVQPPSLTAPLGAQLESPRALLKRSKEVAKTVKQFIRENRSMQLSIDGKKYPRAEVWQFAAACFGITAMVTKTEEVISDGGQELGFVSIAHAINSSGRVISGAEAACMCSEPEWGNQPSFKLRAMAETRSCSRVLRHILAYVMVMAGLCPTPAEEMDRPKTEREFKTQCSKSDCGNAISEKRRTETRRKYGQALCIPCEKRMKAEQGEKLMEPITDAKFVEQSVAKVKERKEAKTQPIVATMDAMSDELTGD